MAGSAPRNSQPERTQWTVRQAVEPGLLAIRRNWVPIAFIQLAALLLVAAYFQIPALQTSLKSVETLKEKGGLAFAFFGGMIAGAIVPEIAKLLTGRLRSFNKAWLQESAYNGLVYGIIGIQVDLFYRSLTATLGGEATPTIVITKTLIDQLIFSPLLSIPTATFMFRWRYHRFQRETFAKELQDRFYVMQIVPGVLMCWAFWVPVLCCAYSLPPLLQFPFSMLAEAAWSILFVFMTQQAARGSERLA